ncbi:MAG: 5-formyltetrahydrofolate cyclo-ligase [Devosia sp.]
MTLSHDKAALRRAALKARQNAARAIPNAAERLAQHADALPPFTLIAAYVPMRDEIDPVPLALAASSGRPIALPAVAGKQMSFRAWCEGDPLTDGPFGTREPMGESVVPDLLLVPLLAFTRKGDRLGYGAGHYDRWLARHEATAIGVAYGAQEVPSLPVEPHDVPLTAILTEADIIHCRAPGALCV